MDKYISLTFLVDGTVIGNTVNVAARMLSLTKIYGTKFVTTSKCISQIGQQPSTSTPSSPPLTSIHIPSQPPPVTSDLPPSQPKHSSSYRFYNQRVLDTVRVPGKDEALVIHEIFDNESLVAKIKPTYESALALYKERRFEEALKMFEEALVMLPADVPSQMLRDRCVRYIREGTPSDWDGVNVVSVK